MKLNQILLALFASATLASAATTLTYNFNTTLGVGVQSPSGSAPWLTASFTDVKPNQVLLVIQNNLLEDEFVSKLMFNLDGNLFSNSDFTFSSTSTSGSFDLPTVITNIDSINGGVGSTFDVSLDFSTSNAGGGSKRFNQVDSVTYLITYSGAAPFSANTFDAIDKSSQVNTTAHVLSIGTDNTSAWVIPTTQIPEPAAALLGAFGFLALLRRRR